MKKKEFIKRVKELGFEIREETEILIICAKGLSVGLVGLNDMYYMRVKTNVKELFDICVEYARTPIEEREEEQKFYLQKMKSFYEARKDEESMFLTLVINYNFFLLSYMQQCQNYQTQFTQKEIDKIKEEQHTDLSEFKQMPVEELESEI